MEPQLNQDTSQKVNDPVCARVGLQDLSVADRSRPWISHLRNNPKLNAFWMLVKFNVERNYLGYVLPKLAEGERPVAERVENHYLIAALIIEADGRHANELITNVIDEEPGVTLEELVRLHSIHYDGGILKSIEGEYSFAKFGNHEDRARALFNNRYGHNIVKYSYLEQKILPKTFTVGLGGKQQTGTRTTAFNALALALPGKARSHIMKVTAFGETGVGKVLTMYVEGEKVHLYEFFLYKKLNMPKLLHRPDRQATPDIYFNPIHEVVGIVRHYETDLNPNVRWMLELVMEYLAGKAVGNGSDHGSCNAYLEPRMQDRFRKKPAMIRKNGKTSVYDFHLQDKLERTVRSFDGYFTGRTPIRDVLASCSIDPYVKAGLDWILNNVPPPRFLREAAKEILSKPSYLLCRRHKKILDEYQRFLQGVIIEPRCVFVDYVSPKEVGIPSERIQRVCRTYCKPSNGA